MKYIYRNLDNLSIINNGKKLTLGDGECRVQLNVAIIVICPQTLAFGRAPLPLVTGPVIVLEVQEPPRPALDSRNCHQQAQGNHGYVGGDTQPHLTVT